MTGYKEELGCWEEQHFARCAPCKAIPFSPFPDPELPEREEKEPLLKLRVAAYEPLLVNMLLVSVMLLLGKRKFPELRLEMRIYEVIVEVLLPINTITIRAAIIAKDRSGDIGNNRTGIGAGDTGI